MNEEDLQTVRCEIGLKDTEGRVKKIRAGMWNAYGYSERRCPRQAEDSIRTMYRAEIRILRTKKFAPFISSFDSLNLLQFR